MLIGQTDMFLPVRALGLRGRVGDQWNMSAFHQGPENKTLHTEAEYKRAVDSFIIVTLQNRRGPYKRSSERDQASSNGKPRRRFVAVRRPLQQGGT